MRTFSAAEPYWIVEVYQQGASYRHPAGSTAEVLVDFCAGLLRLGDEAGLGPKLVQRTMTR